MRASERGIPHLSQSHPAASPKMTFPFILSFDESPRAKALK